MKFEHFLTDPFAPHPVVNRKTVCFGGGGGGEQEFQVGDAPSVPDYSDYIKKMTATGEKLQGYGADLYKWAQDAGIKVSGIADEVSGQAKDIYGKAGEYADLGVGQYKDMMAKWKQQYDPLYAAQAKEAQSMIGDLGNTQEQYAGKYGADVAQAFDASKQAHDRALRSYGLKAPGSGSQALDGMVSNQRGLATVAAGEQGRNAARNEAWQRVSEAQNAGKIYGEFAGQGASMANQGRSTQLAAGNQQIGAPESAISTTVGAYNPALSSYQQAYPWMKAEGDTMATSYNQQLAGYSAHTNAALKAHQMSQESEGGDGGMLGGIGGSLLGAAAGSIIPGVGTALGSSIGGMLGKTAGGAISNAKGGMIRGYEDGGPVPEEGGDQMVDPSMSASEGAITDDVPARLNVGEFVFPKDVVEWRGEAWMQKEIMKARKERESQTVAESEQGPPMSAIEMQAPQFQSGEPPL
jgi:hypothetical protein